MALSISLHITILVGAIDILPDLAALIPGYKAVLIISAFVAILIGHTVEIWVWALSLKLMRALPSLEDAVYFALVTTTTLGYGDLTLDRRWRIFGAMAAVNGLMTFGLSTAFLIDVFARTYTG